MDMNFEKIQISSPTIPELVLDSLLQAGTLAGNPLATAAGLATLRILKRDPTIYSRLAEKGARIAEAVRRAAGERAEVAQIGSLLGISFAGDAEAVYREW